MQNPRGSLGDAARRAVRADKRSGLSPPPEEVVVGFEHGLPVSIDGDELSLHELVGALNERAGAYGIGRIDMIENRAVGIKSREVYEAPAAITLIESHRALEDLVLTKDELRLKRMLEVAWTELVYEGLWFSPAREAIDAFVDQTQGVVTGDVRVVLGAGTAVVSGRRSQQALYAETLASYAPGETFPHEAAEGSCASLAGERACRGSQAGDGRDDMTLWSGRVREGMAPEVWSYLLADDAELLPYDLEGTRLHARRPMPPACSTTRSSRRRS